ncbi:AMP-binding protein [Streptomyces sp. SID4919]|uniref:AMP-binding protein n=1 Tax=unclassified Streptomyces TaxID=2593676 RepID=UPI000823E4CF|nr:AMP-binding protein [Streptomyces sp. SID4919]SCK61421.1 Non-ribosomal peptide synthetase modules and related proteins [Streptomyces sp. AmelKG-E11A]
MSPAEAVLRSLRLVPPTSDAAPYTPEDSELSRVRGKTQDPQQPPVEKGAGHKETTIHEAFERIAIVHPNRKAVVSGSGEMTYAELAAASRRIARHLIARGVQPGDLVPVLARRSAELAAVLLGVLMAGGAYGILDVRWPASRITHLLDAMRPPVVLADATGSAGLDQAGIVHITVDELRRAALPSEALAADLPHVSPDARATVFWTSGSTGSPKAVLSPHQATTRLFTPDSFMDFGHHPVMIHAAAVAWDAFTLELWSSGACSSSEARLSSMRTTCSCRPRFADTPVSLASPISFSRRRFSM